MLGPQEGGRWISPAPEREESLGPPSCALRSVPQAGRLGRGHSRAAGPAALAPSARPSQACVQLRTLASLRQRLRSLTRRSSVNHLLIFSCWALPRKRAPQGQGHRAGPAPIPGLILRTHVLGLEKVARLSPKQSDSASGRDRRSQDLAGCCVCDTRGRKQLRIPDTQGTERSRGPRLLS